MIVQLRGVGFVNKGAELMLHTVVRRLAVRHPGVQPALHHTVGTMDQRRAIGLLDVVWLEHSPIPGTRGLMNLLATLHAARSPLPDAAVPDLGPRPRGKLRRVGWHLGALSQARARSSVLGSQVGVVLDLSGFAYGDPWGPATAEIAASYFRQIRRKGGRIVLMPQQLGPFKRKDTRDAFRRLSRECDLIFARDAASYEAASSIGADSTVLRQAPDFTILQAGTPPADDRYRGRACIVPNFKMLRETATSVRMAYADFLRRCVIALRKRGVPCFVLIHEHSGRDHEIADVLGVEVGGIEVVSDPDPLRIKGIIGASRITIGSRFHGLVSALSQSVPSLATSWSHKYEFLLGEYGCRDCLVSPTLTDAQLSEALDGILDDGSRERIIASLTERNERQKQRVSEMWAEVDALLEETAFGDPHERIAGVLARPAATVGH